MSDACNTPCYVSSCRHNQGGKCKEIDPCWMKFSDHEEEREVKE